MLKSSLWQGVVLAGHGAVVAVEQVAFFMRPLML
jgi:hypothetical protein